MKSLLSIIIGIIIIGNANTQNEYLPARPYEKLKFISGVSPLWYETIYTPELINPYCEGYNGQSKGFDQQLENFILKDGFIYSVYHLSTEPHLFGSYVEKRRISDGTLVWQYIFNQDSIPYPEMTKNYYINGDGDLILYGLRALQKDKPNMGIGFAEYDSDARMTYRKIDGSTGQLLEYINPSEEDTTVIRCIQSYWPTLSMTKFYPGNNEEEIKVVIRVADGNQVKDEVMAKTIINKKGEFIAPVDTVILGNVQYGLMLKQLHKSDSLIYVESSEDYQSLRLKVYNTSLDLLSDLPMERGIGPFGELALYSVDDQYIIIKNTYLADTAWFNDIRYYVYDYDGHLLKDLKLNLDYGYYPYIKYLPEYDKFIMVAKRYMPFVKDRRVEMLEWKGVDELESLHIWDFEDTLRYSLVDHIFVTNDSIVMCQFESSRYYTSSGQLANDISARARAYLLFDAASIGLKTTSTKGVTTSDTKFLLYPNPCHDELRINFENSITGLLVIYDMLSHKVHSEALYNTSKTSIDVSSLIAGQYIATFIDENGSNTVVRFVKI